MGRSEQELLARWVFDFRLACSNYADLLRVSARGITCDVARWFEHGISRGISLYRYSMYGR